METIGIGAHGWPRKHVREVERERLVGRVTVRGSGEGAVVAPTWVDGAVACVVLSVFFDPSHVAPRACVCGVCVRRRPPATPESGDSRGFRPCSVIKRFLTDLGLPQRGPGWGGIDGDWGSGSPRVEECGC